MKGVRGIKGEKSGEGNGEDWGFLFFLRFFGRRGRVCFFCSVRGVVVRGVFGREDRGWEDLVGLWVWGFLVGLEKGV